MKNSKEKINFDEIEAKHDPQLSLRKLGQKLNIIINT